MESPFLGRHIPLLLKRFSISYERESTCIEYFLYSKEKLREISKNLIVSHETFTGNLYVSKYYPEIYKEIQCKYLSAAFFYMMVHHAVKMFHLANNCCVNLEAEREVFDDFYARLDDFDFKIHHNRIAKKVCARGHYQNFDFSTDMVTHHLI